LGARSSYLLALLLVFGCGRLNYGAATDAGNDAARDVSVVDSGSRDTAVVDAPPGDTRVEDTRVGDPDTGGDSGLTCADIDAGRGVGLGLVSGDSTGASNTYLECGEGPEQLVSWAAPATGLYSVRVTSTTMVPQLGVLADDCVGAEIACDLEPAFGGDFGPSTSQVVRRFAAAEPVVFVVSDSFTDVGGAYTMDIEEASCDAAVDAGMTLGLLKGSTTPGSRWFDGTCGRGDTREATIRFEAPMDGSYDIDTAGSGFDTVLYVRDGDCSGPELACNNDRPGGGGTGMTPDPTSVVRVSLTAGQVIFIVVDGFGFAEGFYALNIIYLGVSA